MVAATQWRLLAICVVWSFVGVIYTATASIEPQKETQSDDALRQDAEYYAKDQGISVDEAVRRLKLQPALGKLGAELERRHPNTYAGSWIQHRPTYGFVVNVTRNVEEIRADLLSTAFAEMVEVRKVARSTKQLEADQREAGRAVEALKLPFESDINVFKNRAELYILDRDQFEAALKANPNVRIPGGVVIIETGGFSSLEDF